MGGLAFSALHNWIENKCTPNAVVARDVLLRCVSVIVWPWEQIENSCSSSCSESNVCHKNRKVKTQFHSVSQRHITVFLFFFFTAITVFNYVKFTRTFLMLLQTIAVIVQHLSDWHCFNKWDRFLVWFDVDKQLKVHSIDLNLLTLIDNLTLQ